MVEERKMVFRPDSCIGPQRVRDQKEVEKKMPESLSSIAVAMTKMPKRRFQADRYDDYRGGGSLVLQ
jgi:hypothetical protein